jgi:(p)ppGpp synthase/HD superfamily hydrolase
LIDLSERFEQAMLLAFQLHKKQRRKGSQTPYLAHLFGTVALVLEDSGDEDEAIAALLHDAPEDQGGLETLEQIRQQFGERVAQIVDGCTDSYEAIKSPWKQRKEQYLAHLQTASVSVRRVSLADKVYNARTIVTDLRTQGEQIWSRFNGGKTGSLWYYRRLVQIFQELYRIELQPSPMVAMLAEAVAQIEELAIWQERE